MDYDELHVWNVTPAEAREIQQSLREKVIVQPLAVDSVRTVAGADISFEWRSDIVYAGIVTVRLPDRDVIDQSGVTATAAFPYVPGLLSFREIPPLLEAWKQLNARPDALICDGQGFAHPRRFGLACHAGLLLDIPTVGCAKSLLVGKHEPVGENRGDWQPLMDKDEVIGAALRTRQKVAPVYVSIGHKVDLESAIALVLRCAPATRLPDTTRHAHAFVNAMRKSAAGTA
jgi:deoxyribonuclease V